MTRAARTLRGPQIYTQQDADAIADAADLAVRVLDVARHLAKPGVTPIEIERCVERNILAAGARPVMATLTNSHGLAFGHACAIAVDDHVAHTRPTDRPLGTGQVVTIDLMLDLGGWHADVAETVVVGGGGHPLLDALDAVWDAGLAALHPGAEWSTVARAMAQTAERVGVRLVRGLAGHGIGLSPHERPVLPLVPGPADVPVVFRPGMVVTFEPAVTTGHGQTIDSEDGWAIRTADGVPSVARERMILIELHGIRVLTSPGLDDSGTAVGYNPLRTGPGSGV